MTPEQSAAFINAQAALLNAELAMMAAANTERERNGYALAYGPEQYAEVIARYEATLGFNATVTLFGQSQDCAKGKL